MATIAWLVPSLIEGSGGHRTILQNAEYLARHGYTTTIYLEDDRALQPGEPASAAISRMFGYHFSDVRIGWDSIQHADIVFATIWYSAKVVRDLPFDCKRAYFVQDWEAYFNPMGDTYLMAESSYRYGLVPITIGNWLRYELARHFDIGSFNFDFCADKNIYRPLANVKKERAICFICQPEKPRRGAVLGIEALGIVKHLMPDIKIYLYGSNEHVKVWFPHTRLGLLSLEECNALYNRCMVGLCISSTNPSRIPFEMMAAGLPVVELYRDNTLYDLPESATLLCDPNPESIAEGLIYVLKNIDLRDAMSAAAISFMQDRDLEVGMNQFLNSVRWIDRHAVGTLVPLDIPIPLYTKGPMVSGHFVATLPKELREATKRFRTSSRAPKTLLQKAARIVHIMKNAL